MKHGSSTVCLDDTFAALKKWSFDQVHAAMSNVSADLPGPEWRNTMDSIYAQAGWKQTEYFKEHYRRYRAGKV